MYMGYWDQADEKPKRISREKEYDYYQKFMDRIPGFHDDSEWWKQVELADQRPMAELVECPVCHAQNLKEAEECQVCHQVLIGKSCLNDQCKKEIPRSASSCPHCGTSQVPEIKEPWTCLVCGNTNQSESESCTHCVKPKGSLNPGSKEFLSANSDKAD